MSEPKIAREVAEAEVRRWAEQLGAGEPSDNAVRALMDGRILFDETAETFLVNLRKPITLENGPAITEIVVRELTALEISDAAKGATSMDIRMRTIAAATDIKGGLGVLQRMKQRDLMLVGDLLDFFG